MKRFYADKPIKSITGRTIKVPVFDLGTGELILDKGAPVQKDGTVRDALELLINSYPRNKLTLESVNHGVRVMDQVRKSGSIMELEDADYEWVIKSLKDEAVGIQMFAMNTLQVIEALQTLIDKADKSKKGA